MPATNLVVILGAGINGCAIARELALNGVGVCLVDTADVASGATAYSSRLIHGGLRYLEYGDFGLVRESLAERTRLLRLAPQFVRPLKLSIPVSSRMSGFFAAARRFLGIGRSSAAHVPRGMWIVRLGLWLYDRYARDPLLPGHSIRRTGETSTIPTNDNYPWLCDYWDAQILYPERFVLALLADAEHIARQSNVSFAVYTYHEARLRDQTIEIRPVGNVDTKLVTTLSPTIIINATGAAVDRTLARLQIQSPPLMGPTKGSHFVTFQPQLRAAIGDQGVYAEAADGRPVFILPLGEGVLVGTTDIPFDQPPETAVATSTELDYLLAAVNHVFPQVQLDRHDIDFHYAGVRPLPRVDATSPAGITRRHWLAETPDAPIPIYSVIGGKLTTCRSLAEQTADTVLRRLQLTRAVQTRDRPIPGGENYPADTTALKSRLQRVAESSGWSLEQVQSLWLLFGTRTADVLAHLDPQVRDNLDGTHLPREVARRMVRSEHARTLGDLVERRLMLLYHRRLTRRCLEQLAQVLVEERMITDAPAHVEQTIEYLSRRYGKRIHCRSTKHQLPSTMAKYILALDQGTTSSRAIVFGHDGRAIAVAQQEFPQILPAPGVVEHDPEAIWSSQLAVAQAALAKAKLAAADIAAIGVTNQRETTILWERATGRPIENAIVWQSRISAGICDQLKANGLEPLFRERTGLVVDAYFSGTKIKHILDRHEGLRRRAELGEVLFGTVDTYLVWRLTGGRRHVTDVSNASRTLLYNIHTLDWDDELLGILGIPRAMFPEVCPSSHVVGETDESILPGRIPIAGIAGDQQAATFGQACFAPGDAKNTYGTGCFMLLNTGERPVTSNNNLLTTIGWNVGGKVTYCLEGSVFVAGAVVQWLRDGLGLIRSSGDVQTLARTVEDSGGVYFVPAFVGLGAPYWDPYARGLIIGLTRGTTAGHIARAAVESMVYQTRDVLEAMQRDAGITLSRVKVDGGAASNDDLLQFQADLLGTPVERPVVAETTALGAAYLAGLAVGYWKDQFDVARNWALDRRFEPNLAVGQRDRLYRKWGEAVKRAAHWSRD